MITGRPMNVVRVSAVVAGLMACAAVADNLVVSNVRLEEGAHAAWRYVQFDLKWDHSWRAAWTEAGTWTNWDAAWVFVTYHRPGDAGWRPATLAPAVSDHRVPAEVVLAEGLCDDPRSARNGKGVGVFLYRSGEGSGPMLCPGVRLKWLCGEDGVKEATAADVRVYGIEMVYVPQGSFHAGDGTATLIEGHFESGVSGRPLRITSERELTLGGTGAENLGNHDARGMRPGYGDDFSRTASRTLPAAFPKGYRAFYCMKYEIAQDQYADFLNALSPEQADARYQEERPEDAKQSFLRTTIAYLKTRHCVTPVDGVYRGEAPDRACAWLSWADVAAYADWAGLRPMTELEFEKACRGPLDAEADAYAEGGKRGAPTESGNNVDGGGAAATARGGPGISYWGIVDMSGGVLERTVTVGSDKGRDFIGTHGDGELWGGGLAGNTDWPNFMAEGAGFRGGYGNGKANVYGRVSDRNNAANTYRGKNLHSGGRAVRTAP